MMIGSRPLLLLLLLARPAAPATVEVRYLPDRENARRVVLENESFSYTLLIDRGVYLEKALNRAAGTDYLAGNPPLLLVATPGDGTAHPGYQLFRLEEAAGENGPAVMVYQESAFVENPLRFTHRLELDPEGGLLWSLAVENRSGMPWREPVTWPFRMRFPFIQDYLPAGDEGAHRLIPAGAGLYAIDSVDICPLYFTSGSERRLPVDVWSERVGLGLCFDFSSADDGLGGQWRFDGGADFRSKVFSLRVAPGSKIDRLAQCRVVPHRGDWHRAFDEFKHGLRSRFDFQYYNRPGHESFRRLFVSHFTFLYGHDIYDPDSNRFAIDRFLDEGEANFGGYDYILLWHDYPRTGLDNRDQFDLYEDLPGGLAGLGKLVERCHGRGVKVFIPYKPWDVIHRPAGEHFAQEARIVRQTGADGIFLDTMSESDREFRHELDRVNPDVVFVSEGRPSLEASQLVTGSWNQSGDESNRMPAVDLFRFVFPEHNVHNINRGARKREELVYNAIFNGVGLIVWEDIFGEINPFSWQERVLIRRYNRIVHENADAFLSPAPVPLFPTLRRNFYVNYFPAAGKRVYTGWQRAREKVSRWTDDRLIGPILEADCPPGWHFVDLWNHQPVPVQLIDEKSVLSLREETASPMYVIAGFPSLIETRAEGGLITIRVDNPPAAGVIEVNTVDNLTLQEEEKLTLPAGGGTVDLSSLELDFPYIVLVKLKLDGRLVDEAVIELGWKKF